MNYLFINISIILFLKLYRKAIFIGFIFVEGLNLNQLKSILISFLNKVNKYVF